MAGPGIPAGVRVKQQARTIDFLPTLLEVMGGRAPSYVKGSAWCPRSPGKPVATDISYAETLYPKMNMNWSELRAIRTNRWKYIRAPRPELYDLTCRSRGDQQCHPAAWPRGAELRGAPEEIHFAGGQRERESGDRDAGRSASWISSSRSATWRARAAVRTS